MSFAQALANLVPPSAFPAVGARSGSSEAAIDGLLPDECKYPPKNRDELTKIIASIDDADVPKLLKYRVLYYLFLDCGPEFAAHFAKEVWMPLPQQQLIQGLRLLDRHELTPEAIAGVAGPWDLDVPCEDVLWLHQYIVSALKHEPTYVVAYIDSKELAYKLELPYIEALRATGAFGRALALKREIQMVEILGMLAEDAVKDDTKALALANLPFTRAEWEEVSNKLNQQPPTSPEGKRAAKIAMVRALHLGDLATVNRLKSFDPEFELLSQGVGDL